MDVKEYLSQCSMLCREVECLKARLITLRDIKDGVQAHFVKEIISRRAQDKLAAAVAECDALEEVYVRKVTMALRLKYDYQQLFEKIPDRKLRMILELKYIDMLEWSDIAQRLFYSERSCFNMHKLALVQIQKVWEETKTDNHIARDALA